jgi:class 3 adenylate cyclase
MKTKLMIIDDEKSFIEDIFKPKLKQWVVNYDILSNKTFGDISEDALPEFTMEVLDIIEANRDELAVIFLDLGLNESDQSASLGFTLAQDLRGRLFDIPIIALTRFETLVEEGYLYDLDKYIKKTKFGNLGAIGFHAIMNQVILKRERLVQKIPQYYEQLKELRKERYASLSAFGCNFNSKSINMENNLKDSVSLLEAGNEMNRMTVVMFVDMWNSVRIKEEQGFFEGLYMARMHNEIVTNIIYGSGGKVVKYIGDCVMARYDYEDDSHVDASSINAAIKINEAIKRHNKNFRRKAQHQLKTKIGIAIGKVIDFYGNDPQGICVDMAARLQSSAGPSEIMVCSELYSYINAASVHSDYGKAINRSGQDYFEGPNDIKIKGFKEKEKVFLIHWAE